MKFKQKQPIKIIMLGAGGTGGHIAPNLYRLLYSLKRKARFIIVDGDALEEKNLVRQHFSKAELGMNKARAVAERYADAFGMAPEYIPDFIEDKETLKELLTPENLMLPYEPVPSKKRGPFNFELTTGKEEIMKTADELVILIGAVDNNKSRKLCHEVFMESRNLIYIDSGNGEFSGQVVCGIRRGGKTMQKPVGVLYPDVLEETDKFPSELSCAEASVSAPQAITANITAATIVVNLIYNIVALRENEVRSVSFSTKSVNVKSYIKNPN